MTTLTLTSNKSTAVVGEIIYLMVTSSPITFSPNIKDNLVTIGGIPGIISYLSSTDLGVIIPLGCDSGINNIIVTRLDLNVQSTPISVNIIYKNVVFAEVTVDPSGRFIPVPGTEKARYNKDIGYSNYKVITDETSILQNVLSIVLTRKGERLFNSAFGTTVGDLLFKIVGDPMEIESKVLIEIKTQVSLYEPRAIINIGRSFVEFTESSNSVVIVLAVEVPGGSEHEVGITISGITRY